MLHPRKPVRNPLEVTLVGFLRSSRNTYPRIPGGHACTFPLRAVQGGAGCCAHPRCSSLFPDTPATVGEVDWPLRNRDVRIFFDP